MVEKGARNIILISRSGTNPKTRELIKDMEAFNARLVVHECDVGDKKDVDPFIMRMGTEMPPVRGVIHSAMVLEVGD